MANETVGKAGDKIISDGLKRASPKQGEAEDWRNINSGRRIPTKTYSDQPYIVKTDDGAWLCTVTTGAGHEGQPGQHVISMRSTDEGQSWSEPVAPEPVDGPEASYAVLLKVPSGRIYCFYNHNTDNVRRVIADNPPFKNGTCGRVDSLGYYVFKYSDDHGRTWSEKRTAIPVREMEIDRQNAYGGKIRFFWNVGKPFVHEGAGYVSLHKVGGFGEGFFTRSEGVLLKSPNILTERDPARIVWETLPDGGAGLRTPSGGGPIAEEQSYSVLSDGSFYCVYRTVDGHPACSYSRDGGHTWRAPQYKRFADGRIMKHSRAANFAWKCANGKLLYWFHNHGGHDYEDRNPVWLCGGVEADSPEGKIIQWSQPEILLYDDDPYIRMSYPDLIEEDGRYFITETQKNAARTHEIPIEFLECLWGQFVKNTVASQDVLVEWPLDAGERLAEITAPRLPGFVTRNNRECPYGTLQTRKGVTMELWVRFESLEPGQVLLDSRTEDGRGFCLRTASVGTVELVVNDGRTQNSWECDRDVLREGAQHHIVTIVDGGPRVILFVIDGKLCDGGALRQFGWGRFSPYLRSANGSGTVRIGPAFRGTVASLRVYGRALRVSEAIGNHRAGVGARAEVGATP